MNYLKAVLACSLLAVSPFASAGEAKGTMEFGGAAVTLHSATALAYVDYDGTSKTLVLLSDEPIDLAPAMKTDDPLFALHNDPKIDAAPHAKVFIESGRISIIGHKVGDHMQYLASQKFGLDASVSKVDAGTIKGRLRAGEGSSVKIDAEFTTSVAGPVKLPSLSGE
jgi:hypothetical protein